MSAYIKLTNLKNVPLCQSLGFSIFSDYLVISDQKMFIKICFLAHLQGKASTFMNFSIFYANLQLNALQNYQIRDQTCYSTIRIIFNTIYLKVA